MTSNGTLTFQAVEELEPGEKIQAVFAQRWRSYREWYLRDGATSRPSYAQCRRALREHMPELLPIHEALCDLAGGGDLEARFLSLYCPTPFLTGCSQAVWKRDELALVRNYDYAAHLCDGVNLLSAWTGSRTIVMTDCVWGVLDGINDDGLSVALSFGGRRVVGRGFAITLILRYILETCRETDQAVEVLKRVPSHMAYNVSVVDRRGCHATVFVAPDRPTTVSDVTVVTNHQGEIEWPEHAQLTATIEREQYLSECIRAPSESLDDFVGRFLAPPLFRGAQLQNWRTLYTATYLPHHGMVTYLWPGRSWPQSFDCFLEHNADAVTNRP